MRILLLGNSYTAALHLPEKLAAALSAEVVAHTRGGARLAEQLNEKTKLGSRTQKALKEEKWDYVILQEMSKGPVIYPERYLESVAKLSKQIKENGSVPVIYCTWAYQKDSPVMEKEPFSYEEMYQKLEAMCHQAAQENGALLADVGTVFFQTKENLYAQDGSHPNALGVEKIVEVLAQTIRQDGIKNVNSK